ncbi:MAG: biotin/lipoyl-binding protein [Candidatus Promineofilum sp.]|nr:biotin/lipoyl-binding protein [Promineifilum sp.]
MNTLQVTIDDQTYKVELKPPFRDANVGDLYEVMVDGKAVAINLPQPKAPISEMEWLIIDDRPYELVFDSNLQYINAYDGPHKVEVQDDNQAVARPRSGDGRVKAPIPGLIIRVLVEPGAAVRAGQALLILEAMKMENEIRAPFDGVVSSISTAVGQSVVRNQVLIEVQ